MYQRKRMPKWLKKKIYASQGFFETKELLTKLNINTVCESALCPNRGECFTKRSSAFMILGDVCTRDCGFCAVVHGKPAPINKDEIEKISQAVAAMGLRHVVITSVTRDDLDDGGACQFIRVIEEIRRTSMGSTIEVLTPDFNGHNRSIESVAMAKPNVFNHNIETVPSLYKHVRPGANYYRSLELLRLVKDTAPDIYIKSGIMLGLGETQAEVYSTMEDIRAVGCHILTIGQYLQPAADRLPVEEYIPPEVFDEYRCAGLDMGFKYVFSGPFVRSSFHARDVIEEINQKEK